MEKTTNNLLGESDIKIGKQLSTKSVILRSLPKKGGTVDASKAGWELFLDHKMLGQDLKEKEDSESRELKRGNTDRKCESTQDVKHYSVSVLVLNY